MSTAPPVVSTAPVPHMYPLDDPGTSPDPPKRLRTLGLSPKLIGAITTPLGAFAYDLIVTGQLNRPALGALSLGVIAALAVYIAPPGQVVEA